MRKLTAQFIRRSPSARAALGIFRAVWQSTRTGMTVPAVCWLLGKRFSPSTVAHDCVSLARLWAIVLTGRKVRTPQRGTAREWSAA